MIGGEPCVFVRTEDGFVRRKVETGASDDDFVEIISGIEPGERIATTHTFVLKSEQGKTDLESLD
jgi:cobalt-zinc-cadmium efflux system membrane fusion protein